MARPPRFIPPEPNEYNFDEFVRWIDQLDVDVEGVPVWFKDQVVNELTVNLKAAIKPKALSMADLEMYGDEGMPGMFGIDVNLNPIDLIQDPKKYVSKTVQGWWRDFKSYEDYETKIEQRLWNSVLEGSTPPGKLGGPAARALEESHGGSGLKLAGESPGTDAATAGALGVVYNQYGADAYKAAGDNLVSFVMGAENPGIRDSRHTGFLGSTVQAIYHDLDQNENTYIANAGGGADFRTVAEEFRKKAEMAWSSSGVFALDSTMDYLAKYALEGDQEMKLSELDPATGRLRDVRTDLLTETNSKRRAIHGKARGALEKLDRIKIDIEWDVGLGQKSPEDLLRYKRATEKLEGALVRIADTAGIGITSQGQARKLMRQLSLSKEALTGGNMFNPSAEARFLRYLEDEMANTGDNAIGGLIERGGMVNAQKLQYIRKYADTERGAHTIEEFVSSVEEGKLGDYLFRRLRTWSFGYTAGYVANKILTETHHLGLIVNEDTLLVFPGMKSSLGTSWIGKPFRAMIQGENGVSKFLFRNRFGVEVPVNGIAKKVTFEGGRDLRAVIVPGGLYSMVKEGIPSASLGAISSANLSMLLKNPRRALTHAYFQQMVNGGKMFNLNPLDPDNDLEKLEKKIKELMDFQQRILLHAHELGLTPAQALANGEFLTSMVLQLGEINTKRGVLGITRQYAGLLEKFWLKANQAQDWIFARPGVGGILRFWVHGKTIVSKKVEKLVADAVSWILAKVGLAAIAGATGGIGAALEPIIDKVLKPLLRFAVNRTFKFARNVGSAVLKGDFYGLQKDLEKSFQASMKFLLYFLGIPVGCGTLLILFLSSTLVTSITHVTPSRDNAELSGRGEGIYFEGWSEGDSPIPVGGPADLAPGAPNEKVEAVADAAFALADDLNMGFFQYYNQHPDYYDENDSQDLFDEALFGQWAAGYEPDLILTSSKLYDRSDSLFWCYWLPVKAFASQEAHDADVTPFKGDDTGETPTLISEIKSHFSSQELINNVDGLDAHQDVRAGYVAIIDVTSAAGYSGKHVSIVYQVTTNELITVDANTPSRSFSYTLNADGTIQTKILGSWTFTITGFGIPY